MKNTGIKNPYPIELNFSSVSGFGFNNFMTAPAKNEPRILSAPISWAKVTKVKIKKNANLISNCVVDLSILSKKI
jgi:hypothetical protein